MFSFQNWFNPDFFWLSKGALMLIFCHKLSRHMQVQPHLKLKTFLRYCPVWPKTSLILWFSDVTLSILQTQPLTFKLNAVCVVECVCGMYSVRCAYEVCVWCVFVKERFAFCVSVCVMHVWKCVVSVLYVLCNVWYGERERERVCVCMWCFCI